MEQVAAFLTNALLYMADAVLYMADVDLRLIYSVPHLLRSSSRLKRKVEERTNQV